MKESWMYMENFFADLKREKAYVKTPICVELLLLPDGI